METGSLDPIVRYIQSWMVTTQLILPACRCAIAVTKLLTPILERNGLPGAAASLVCGDVDVGKMIVGSSDVDLGEAWTTASRYSAHDTISQLHGQ